MMRIEWEDTWITTLIDAGFSPSTARATYRAMYKENGPDYNKNPAQEAMAMLGKINIPEDFSSFSEKINARHSNNNPLQRSSKLDL